jgi:hypothetical protein
VGLDVPRAVALAALLAAAGCLKAPELAPPPMCTLSSDCPSGQTCHDGSCSDLTSGSFDAELFAPPSRTDLPARAEVGLDIQQGTFQVVFAQPVDVHGRIVLRFVDQSAPSVAGQVSFRRPSRIKGAPDYVVTVDALAGVPPDQPSYIARLLPGSDPNNPAQYYTATAFPDDGTISTPPQGTQPPNRLCPPVSISNLYYKSNALPLNFYCDLGGLRTVMGSVIDADGHGISGLTVRAYTSRTPAQLVSSTALTDDAGNFVLYLSIAAGFDIRVTPAAGSGLPSLRRPNVQTQGAVGGTTVTADAIQYPSLPPLAPYPQPIFISGTEKAIGATVHFAATLPVNGTDILTYETDATVGPDGNATASLIPGRDQDLAYKVTVLPPQGSRGKSLWQKSVDVGPPMSEGVTLPAITLDARTLVTGRVLDAAGRPVANMTVQPQVDSGFTAVLTPDQAASLASLPLPQATTNSTAEHLGEFSLYLDPTLYGVKAVYNLALVPPSGSSVPSASKSQVTVAGTDVVKLGDIKLPAATVATGVVRDWKGLPVADAELRVYTISDQAAQLTTLAKSGKDGTLTVVLPSP